MSATDFLLKPIFWIFFTVFVIAAMFVYGMSLVKDNTLLAQATRKLEAADKEITELNGRLADTNRRLANNDRMLTERTQQFNQKEQDLSECTQQLNLKEQDLSERTQQLAQKDQELADRTRQIFNRDTTIAGLNDTIRSLRVASHRYGKDHGQLTIYNDCACSNLRVWVDNQFIGEAKTKYSPSSAACGAEGTATATVPVGNHHVIATDGAGRRWNLDVTIREDTCFIQGLTAR
jgi:hypothetical protein